jgi:hypothetical protein
MPLPGAVESARMGPFLIPAAVAVALLALTAALTGALAARRKRND